MRTWVGVLLAGIAVGALANPANDRLLQMNEAERAAVFGRYLRANGESCDRVVKIKMQGLTKDRKALWDVGCANGRAYALMFYPDADGSTKILDCRVQEAVGGGRCFR